MENKKASAAQGKVFLNRFGQLGKGWGWGGEGVGLVMETIKKVSLGCFLASVYSAPRKPKNFLSDK